MEISKPTIGAAKPPSDDIELLECEVFQADMLGHVAQKMSLLMSFLLGPQLPEPTLGNGRKMRTKLLQQRFAQDWKSVGLVPLSH
ncbi:hypothetical protein HGM15179_007356 [Zosterops borbonicus]|uniref:Uncharacterized protein n=1 Tax=Zosterops borbonicus TaxID=364589 RepID=A0A8K1LMJ5_9PASS|nr:hypothetical protein HGM15179_007356 [Zosterops borbonicus]